jgi:hypothetical protein
MCKKKVKSESVRKVSVSVVNFIRSHRLNRNQFQSSVSEIHAKIWRRLLQYSSMSELWDSIEIFFCFSYEIINIDAHK